MDTRTLANVALATALATVPAVPGSAGIEETPAQPVQKVAARGTFVRIAHNDEGWVTLGFRTANHSVGQEWMLLDVGLTLQQGVASQTLKRSDIALLTPTGKVVTLASQEDFQKAGYLRALNRRASVARDPIDYFPAGVTDACFIRLFANPTGDSEARIARDVVELASNRGCVGRLYFHLPDGIGLGPYNLGVKFVHTLVRAPFRIMTGDEEDELEERLEQERRKAKGEEK